ncbi:transporter substrate-binding domain-containing protein [Lentilitoribacter sp. EG35]|uniref:transporter substrate-binding domain-containing protein n=1 Tax=Lentilitoribacter sp. EG35 TaxID=3234192 RepID=UPI00345F7482
MKVFKTLTGVALAALITTAAMADNHAIRMGTEGAYAPYNFINDAGEVDGFEREVGDELCKRAKLECTWVTNEWDSIIPNLVSGNYDTIIAGMSITAERDEVIDFTQEYFPPDPSTYVGLAGTSMDATKGTVAAQTGTIQAGHAAETAKAVVEFATPEEVTAAVRNGEVDAAIADDAFWQDVVKASNGELEFIGEPVMLGGGIGMGVRESDTELKEKMNAAIASMKADGTLTKMIAKWFDGRMVKY